MKEGKGGGRIIDTDSARYLSGSVAADKICMFANQEVSGVTCPPAPSANITHAITKAPAG